MQNEWPHLLADLKAKRDGLNEVIATLERHFTIPDNDITPGPVGEAPRRKYKKRKGSTKKLKAAKKSDRQTDRQTEQRSGHTRERSSEPP